jgi:hypothetical protein
MLFRHPSHSLFGAILALLVATPADALEWSMTPSVSLQGQYNDNIRLTTAAQESSESTIITPRLDLSVQSEIWALSGTARLRDSHYSGVSGLDATDKLYSMTGQYRTPRSQWQLSGSSNKESILTAEYVDPDTNLTTNQIQRNTKSAGLNWDYSLTQTASMRASYQYTDIVYPLGTLSGLFDYHQDNTSLSLSNKFTERTEVFLTGGYSSFVVPTNNYRSEQNTASLGLTHTLTETLKFTLSGGPRKTTAQGNVAYCPPPGTEISRGLCLDLGTFLWVDYAFRTITAVTRGTTYNASLTNQFERTRLTLSASRNIQPSGSGTEVASDTYTLNSSTAISPRNTLSLTTTAYRMKSTEDMSVNDERRYYVAEPRWRWQCSVRCSVELSYRYSYLKYVTLDEPAQSNAYMLSFYYQWPKMVISR